MRRHLRRLPDPTPLGYLGLLSIPGSLVDGLEPLAWCVVFFPFLLWPAVVGTVAPDRRPGDDPTGWIEIGGSAYTRRYLLSLPATMVNPFVLAQSLGQLGGHVAILLRHRGRLPSPNDYEQHTAFRLPFDGTWTVINGGPTRATSHSWGILAQRYALDFVVTDDEGRTHAGDGDDLADYHCFGEPVLAPADGVVVAARDGHRDYSKTGGWLDPFQRDIRGNWVAIAHDGGEYSVLAHLQEGSVSVSPGDRVERGRVLGRCGNSGNSTEPHLHFHVQDHPNFFLGMGLPVRFDAETEIAVGSGDSISNPTEGGVFLAAGQRVRTRAERAADPGRAGDPGRPDYSDAQT